MIYCVKSFLQIYENTTAKVSIINSFLKNIFSILVYAVWNALFENQTVKDGVSHLLQERNIVFCA